MTQAGGALSIKEKNKIHTQLKKKGIKFFVMYGQTEATARMSYVPPERLDEKIESIGIPIPNGNFKLVDSSGDEIKESFLEGEIIYEGPNVSLGYALSGDDIHDLDENNGRLMTGDIGYFDKDNFYYITGRKNRFIKLFGKRINLQDLEKTLEDSGYQSMCFGDDDNLKVATINIDANTKEIQSIITKYLRMNPGKICIYKVPEFPVNNNGKPSLSLLLKNIEADLKLE